MPEIIQLNTDLKECVITKMSEVPRTLQEVMPARNSSASIAASKAVANNAVQVPNVGPASSAVPATVPTSGLESPRQSSFDEDYPPLSPGSVSNLEGLSAIIFSISRLSHTDQAKVIAAVQPYKPSPWSMFYNNGPVSETKFQRLHSQYSCKYQRRTDEAVKALDNLQKQYNATCEYIKQQYHANQNVQLTLKKDLQHAQVEIAAQREKSTAFETVHICSVNAVGAGIEPITDQTFARTFVDYHYGVYQWCRENMRGCEFKPAEQISSKVGAVLGRQFAGKWEKELSVSRAAEMIIWDIIEEYAICPWFPISVLQPYCAGLEMERLSRVFARPDQEDHDRKIDFWRSFTCALAKIEEVGNAIVTSTINSLQLLLNVKEGWEMRFDPQTLLEVVHPIVMTAAELKCQRGLFDVEGVQVGAPFVESTMEDVGNVEVDRKKKWVVKAVLSDGVVRWAHKGAKEILGRACKARVVIAPEQC